MGEFKEIDKLNLDRLTHWAFGEEGGNGARSQLRELSNAVLDEKTGLQVAVDKMVKQQERRNYITIGMGIGMISVLAFLAWQGNQQAQAYLELVNTIKDAVSP